MKKGQNQLQLIQQQDEAFLMLVSGAAIPQIAWHLGCTDRTIYRWMQSPHWKKQENEFSKAAQTSFKLKVDQCHKEFFAGALDVAKSRDPKTANARANLFKSMMEYTKMIERHPKTLIGTNNALISMKLLNDDELSKLSMEEKIKMLTSGVIPEKLKVVNEE